MAKRWMRCKSCGFVIAEDKLGDVCPACGVKRVMFEPDAERISDARREFLDFHVHPVVVHFPQAFAFTTFAIAAILMLAPRFLQAQLLATLGLLTLIQPVVVVGAFVSGLVDAKVRFRKVTTPVLKIKIAAGLLLFLFTVAAAVLVIRGLCVSCTTLYVLAVLLAGGFACTAVLGKLGAGISCSRFPG
jgi:hypothetical protein